MRPRPKTLGFASLLTLLAALYLADAAGAASVARQCRKACGDEVAACVGAGGHPRACRRSVLERCKQEGVAACQGEALAPALAGSCSSPTVLPAQGGTFGGTTSGTGALAGSCGSSGTAAEQVFQWTPAVSGTATIQTCGAGTTFDTVLYLRSGACASGPEVAAGCNDDACTNATGLNRASRLAPTVTAGQTYFIVVDGYGGAQGTFSLTVTPPGASTTTTLTAATSTTTTTTLTAATSTTTTTLPGACSSPTVISAAGGTFSGTTSGTSSQAGSCGSSGTSPEQAFQWTPTVSGTATIQTCGGSTSYDTVLYVRSGACGTGSEIALGCNDDACADATGANRASRITPTVTAGQTYYIFVDGFGGAQGNFTLTVLPPVPTTTTTLPPTTTSTTSTTTTTRPPTTTTTTLPPTTTTTTSTTTSTTSTTTTTRPPTTTTTTLPPPTTTTTSTTTSTTSTTTTPRPSTTTTTTLPPTTTSTTSTTTTTRPPTTTTTTLGDTVSPSVPTALSASAPSCSQINLAWNPSTDSGGSGLKGYNVYRNSVFVKQVLVPGTTTSDPGMAASTVYTYNVAAIDNAGNTSGMSVTASTNTPACATGGQGQFIWNRQFGGAGVFDAAHAMAVATDSSGNVVVAGSFEGTVNFGTGPMTSSDRKS